MVISLSDEISVLSLEDMLLGEDFSNLGVHYCGAVLAVKQFQVGNERIKALGIFELCLHIPDDEHFRAYAG